VCPAEPIVFYNPVTGCECSGGRITDQSRECACPANKPTNDQAVCTCIPPLISDESSRIFSPPFSEIDDDWQCVPPRTFDEQGGCDACPNGNDPANNCEAEQFECPAGRVPPFPGSTECVCDISLGLVENPNYSFGACICDSPLTMAMPSGLCVCSSPFEGGIVNCDCPAPFAFDSGSGCGT
jgi:hypothetical protein